MTTLLFGLLSFLAGIAVGLVLPIRVRASSLFGLLRMSNNDHVNTPRRRPQISRRIMLTAVTVALAANALVGFLLIVTRVQVDAGDAERDRFAACTEDYNRQQGEALAARDDAFEAATATEIELWREYVRLYELASKDPSRIPAAQAAFAGTVRDHVERLAKAQATRTAHPYPDPALCRTLVP